MAPHVATLAEQVMARCDALALCTAESGRITRLFLDPSMHDVHAQVSHWMREANLAPRIDNAGNIVGRRQGEQARHVLLVGSHLDSVPNAGRYDGVLGVLIGIAVCQWLGDTPLPFHVDVVGFSEEEGIRYKLPYLGSSAIAGRFDSAWLDRSDAQGIAMGEAMRTFGLNPAAINSCAYPSGDVVGYIEAHLEQGPLLERMNSPVGVVTGIAGQSRLRIALEGEAGHAGTSPMIGRRDALVAAADFIATVRRTSSEFPGLKATVGYIKAIPNAPNVVPGHVEFSLDVRHLNDEVRKLALERLLAEGERAARAEDCDFKVLEEASQNSVKADPTMVALLTEVVADCNIQPVQLESGAGHDAVVMGQQFPMSMLFIRHPKGISHHPDEAVIESDVGVAIEVLGRYVQRLANEFNKPVQKR